MFVRPAAIAALAALALVPSRASAAGTTRLGNPKMETLTAEIAPPYSAAFNLSTTFASWPPLGEVSYQREDQKDSTGLIYVAQTFNTWPTLQNRGAAMANDAGTFLSWAEMEDPATYQDHVGVFSFTQWSQSFRKDSPDATYKFTITGAKLYAMCMSTGSRAEFAMEAWGYHAGTEFYYFGQDAGLKLVGNPPFAPTVMYTQGGPMSYSGSNPDGINRDYELLFNRHTEEVDLSGIPVGAEFTIVHNEMTQANISYDEVVRAYAYFRDPLDDSTGVEMEISGLTPTDNPQTPTVGVGLPRGGPGAALSPARPNPSSGAVSFQLQLPQAGDVTVGVFDLSGRRVAEIARRPFAAGTHALTWDGRAGDGALAPAGVYFVRAVGPHANVVRRVVRVTGN
jgi:hypothetical protein